MAHVIAIAGKGYLYIVTEMLCNLSVAKTFPHLPKINCKTLFL